MHIYDALIIGCGYAAVGYAQTRKNTLILEEQHACDTAFYLPLKGFRWAPYSPKTEEGKALLSCFEELSLFERGMQCTTAFESAFCKYLLTKNINILLKSRLVRTKKLPDGFFEVEISTNEGLHTVLARRVLRAREKAEERSMTVLMSGTVESLAPLKLHFTGMMAEPAFYEGRVALHIPVPVDMNENVAKVWIYRKLCDASCKGKIISIAPSFVTRGDREYPLDDRNYENPIEAFEAGCFLGKETEV